MKLRDGKRTVKAELLQIGMRVTDGAETGTVATRPRRFNRAEGVNFLVRMDDGRGVSVTCPGLDDVTVLSDH